ncbi:hypothetical protein SDC9_71908 [bioreactor metagenome]|uniref:Uncharacterized protein n=1 Tax=bioreactor metagenome TaxID=1076179 RepID=A0A644YH24_9ZZZZ
MERKAAGAAAGVKQIQPFHIGGDGGMVFPLVEVVAGLLPFLDVYGHQKAVFINDHLVRHLTEQQFLALRESLMTAHLDVAALVDSLWGEELAQQFHQHLSAHFHAGRQNLYRQILAVFVDDKPRQPVGFSKYNPAGVNISECRPIVIGLF